MNQWKIRAHGSGLGMVADVAEMKAAVKIFADSEDGFEVMSLRSGVFKTHKGSDVDQICNDAMSLPSGIGIYFRINPVVIGLDRPAKNEDVIRRRWLYIDVDPVKPDDHKDNPSTDVEKEATSGVCDSVNEYLKTFGFPTPVVVDSGNGYGLFYLCDLPSDASSHAAFRRLLLNLSLKFTSNSGIIDRAVHNANRLAKLPGTWARKGSQSDDRPHRPCKLYYVPKSIEAVTLQQILEAGEYKEESGGNKERTYKPADGKIDSAYVRKALDAECARVALARPGAEEGRNNALNRAAFSLGQLIGGGVLARAEVETNLFHAACQSGLDKDPGCGESGIHSTIRSGIEAGIKQPRGVPESKDPKAKFEKQRQEAKAELQGERLTVRMSEIQPLEVQWVMRNRIPVGFITVMAGRTGIGKSYVSLDLIARLSKGADIPLGGGECFKPSGTLILSEDSPEYVIAPRLIDAGADMKRIYAMTWKAMAAYSLADTDMLNQACDEVEDGVSLLLVDPPTNFLKETDEHKNAEVRQLVMKVVEWALKRNVAVLFILHVNKQATGVDALNRVMGSVAWVTTARIAHALIKDPDDYKRCLWLPLKSNISAMPMAIAYRLKEENGATCVEWIEEVAIDADEAMNKPAPRQRRDIAAGEWLIEKFREQLSWESKELFTMAKEEGVSRNAIFEAKDTLDLPKARKETRENGDVVWIWWVPPDWPAFANPGEDPEPTIPTM